MINSLPRISIVIPVYNKAGYIEETLESIVTQNYSNLEIIIKDGGSEDGTVEIIKDFADRYHSFIHWESQKDNGQLDAIKMGLRYATGDILSYINADDIYQEGAFHKIAEAFGKNKGCLWLSGEGLHIDEHGKEISAFVSRYKNFLLHKNKYFYLLCVNYLMQPSVFITKKAYSMFGPFKGNSDFVLEYDLWLKVGKVQMPVVINDVLSSFRITGESITSKQSRHLILENYRIIQTHTRNPIALFLQKINNIGRMLTILSLNMKTRK